MWSLHGLGEQKFVRVGGGYLGHMTKIATMPIYGKNLLKIFFSGTKGPMTLGLGMQHLGLWPNKVCSNDVLGLTLTFMARSNLLPYVFIWENVHSFRKNDQSDKRFMLIYKHLTPRGSLHQGHRYIYKNMKKNMYKIRVQKIFFKLEQQMSKVIRPFCWHQNFVPRVLSVTVLWLYRWIKS